MTLTHTIATAEHPDLSRWIGWFESAGWSPREIEHLFNLDGEGDRSPNADEDDDAPLEL